MLSRITLLFIFPYQIWISGLFSWLLVFDRFQTSSPWFGLLANFGPHLILSMILAMIVIVWSIASQLVLAFAKVVSLAKLSFSVIYLQALLISLSICFWLLGAELILALPISHLQLHDQLVSINWCFQYYSIGSISYLICKWSKTKSIYI